MMGQMPAAAVFTPIDPQLGVTFDEGLPGSGLGLSLVMVDDLARAGATFRGEIVHATTLATRDYSSLVGRKEPYLASNGKSTYRLCHCRETALNCQPYATCGLQSAESRKNAPPCRQTASSNCAKSIYRHQIRIPNSRISVGNRTTTDNQIPSTRAGDALSYVKNAGKAHLIRNSLPFICSTT